MTAVLSDCGSYRYWLERGDPDAPYVAWVLANPSTADAEKDDPTVRKARGFTERWGYKRFVFVNVFAFRSTKPRGLLKSDNPRGPDNNTYIYKAVSGSDIVVLAWGNAIARPLRQYAYGTFHRINLIRPGKAQCLGYTRDRQPRHPLMLAYTTPLEEYRP